MAEKKIILAGDDDYFRGPLFTMLEQAGFGVLLVSRTADAVKAALAEARDLSLLILDIHHPRVDALAVLRDISAQRPDMKIAAIGVRAAKEDPALLQSLKASGIQALLDRATPLAEVLYLIRQVVQPAASSERRKHPRVPSRLPIEFWAEGEKHRSGFATDLSEGGIFIESLDRYLLGQIVSMRFTLSQIGWTLEAKGEVVYVSPKMPRKTALLPGMGIKFRELADSHREAVRSYVESVLQRLPDLYHKSLIGIDRSTS